MTETYGECRVTQTYDPDSGTTVLHVDRADPIIRIAPSVVAALPESGWPATFDGHVLRICGTNRTVVYKIRDLMEPTPGLPGYWDYIGEWPD